MTHDRTDDDLPDGERLEGKRDRLARLLSVLQRAPGSRRDRRPAGRDRPPHGDVRADRVPGPARARGRDAASRSGATARPVGRGAGGVPAAAAPDAAGGDGRVPVGPPRDALRRQVRPEPRVRVPEAGGGPARRAPRARRADAGRPRQPAAWTTRLQPPRRRPAPAPGRSGGSSASATRPATYDGARRSPAGARSGPYLLEPSLQTHALYLIGYDETPGRDPDLQGGADPGPVAHAADVRGARARRARARRSARAWDIIADQPATEVVLRFAPSVAPACARRRGTRARRVTAAAGRLARVARDRRPGPSRSACGSCPGATTWRCWRPWRCAPTSRRRTPGRPRGTRQPDPRERQDRAGFGRLVHPRTAPPDPGCPRERDQRVPARAPAPRSPSSTPPRPSPAPPRWPRSSPPPCARGDARAACPARQRRHHDPTADTMSAVDARLDQPGPQRRTRPGAATAAGPRSQSIAADRAARMAEAEHPVPRGRRRQRGHRAHARAASSGTATARSSAASTYPWGSEAAAQHLLDVEGQLAPTGR